MQSVTAAIMLVRIAALVVVVFAPAPSYAESCPGSLSENSPTKTIIACVNALEGRLKAVEDQLSKLQEKGLATGNQLKQERTVASLPPNAVVAFDSTTGCPPGWKRLPEADGRFIIGASKKADVTYRVPGGSKSYPLLADYLPRSIELDQGSRLINPHVKVKDDDAGYAPVISKTGDRHGYTAKLLVAGKLQGKEYPVMPPYLPLWLCRQ